MSLTNPNTPITEKDLQDFYYKIKPYIGTDAMPVEDMLEIVTPLPSVSARRMKYSTEEQIVGEWIDGKPIYQKTLTGLSVSLSGNWSSELDVSSLAVDEILKAYGNITDSTYSEYGDLQVRKMSNGNLKFYYSELSGILNQVTIQYTKTTD